ncbi:MerR family transcriptional regulator [Streptomyces echinoruber]|uniref:MerR family transcriptional regulator n=1 Tax=Streptomyces echinoruber TaxID=68898 RepID=UPI00360BF52C
MSEPVEEPVDEPVGEPVGESAGEPAGEERAARETTAGIALTTGALARRLGVSPTTLRSWDRRYGIGPRLRTGGRHRRWTPEDVAVLESMCRLTASGGRPAEAARAAAAGGAPPPPSPPPVPRAAAALPSRAAGPLPPGDVRQECRGLARAAVRLDAPAVAGLLDGAVERHGLAVAWQEVMVPALHAVGRRWASSGDRYVEVEHLLSWHVSTALRRRTPDPVVSGTGSVGPVLLACVPGEQHVLALEALNAALGEQGLPARMLGAAVPAEALLSAVDRLGPAVVVLWAQTRSTASLPLARHLADRRWGVRGARRAPLVVLGGPGWGGRVLPGMARPAVLREAVDLLGGVYGGGGASAGH